MIDLYVNPGSCSFAAHAALEETGRDFRVSLVNLSQDMQHASAFRQINPMCKVPVLQHDGVTITECPAILTYLADLAPDRVLLPQSGLARIHVLEWMSLLASVVHVAFRPVFRPSRLASTQAGQEDVITTGLRDLSDVLALVDKRMAGRSYVLGDSFCLCDLYLFVFVLWMQRPVLAGKLPLFPQLEAFGARLALRESVVRARAREATLLERPQIEVFYGRNGQT